MARTLPVRLALPAHPADPPTGAGARAAVTLASTPDGGLELTFAVQAATVVLPAAPLEPARLWTQTCAECFVRLAGATDYREFNASPTGQRSRGRFVARRVADPDEPLRANGRAGFDGDAHDFRIGFALTPDELPPRRAGAQLLLAPTLVLCHADGSTTHHALHHPAPTPDFHHPGGYRLALAWSPAA